MWALGGVGLVLTTWAVSIDLYADQVQSFVFSSLIAVGGPLVLGQLMRNRQKLNQALVEKAAELDRDRAAEAETAALEERTRIAGELHDVVAHAISAMTIQAGAARRLAVRDPDQARTAFATAETTGREALTELRRILGVLRRQDEELALAPQPSLVHVDGLVRRAIAAGLPTRLHTEGDARALPAGIDLTAYRLVQEALNTRARRGRRRPRRRVDPLRRGRRHGRDRRRRRERRAPAARHARARRRLRRRAERGGRAATAAGASRARLPVEAAA